MNDDAEFLDWAARYRVSLLLATASGIGFGLVFATSWVVNHCTL
jgi:hypothetical protein